MFKFSFLLVVALAIASVSGFVSPASKNVGNLHSKNIIANGPMSSSALMERQWNFNEGRGPFGMKKNAEIWNGRVAQVRITGILLLLRIRLLPSETVRTLANNDLSLFFET